MAATSCYSRSNSSVLHACVCMQPTFKYSIALKPRKRDSTTVEDSYDGEEEASGMEVDVFEALDHGSSYLSSLISAHALDYPNQVKTKCSSHLTYLKPVAPKFEAPHRVLRKTQVMDSPVPAMSRMRCRSCSSAWDTQPWRTRASHPACSPKPKIHWQRDWANLMRC